jgi:hypothetical protein
MVKFLRGFSRILASLLFLFLALLIWILLLLIPGESSGAVLGERTFAGEDGPRVSRVEVGEAYSVEVVGVFACAANPAGEGDQAFIQYYCSNGWSFITSVFHGAVVFQEPGSRAEFVPEDSIFAWWHRTVMKRWNGVR